MEYRSEAVADFRTKFGMRFWDTEMREFVHLMRIILRDPTTWLGSAVNNWDYPASREYLAIADLVDVQLASKSKKRPKPYDRPWMARPKRLGSGSRSIEELRAVLRPGGTDG